MKKHNSKNSNLIDVTGIKLIPGDGGKNCPANGEHVDEFGNLIECCCDECDFLMLFDEISD